MPKSLHFALLVIAGLVPANAQPPAGRALLISDIHLDPFADKNAVKELMSRPASEWATVLGVDAKTPVASRGSDSNYSLVSAVLDAAAKKGPFDYIVFQGDALRHHFRDSFIAAGGSDRDLPSIATKAAVFIADVLQARLHAPVILAIGNNDSTCGDNRMDPDSSFFHDLSYALPVLSRSADAMSSFRSGGYYSIPNPTVPNQDLVVLNSVLWSAKYSPCSPVQVDPGGRELDWLASKLDDVQRNGRTVVLVMHIPPGADVNASLGKCAETPFWKSPYLTRFEEIVEKHREVVRFALAGHTHRDDFRILLNRNGEPLLPIRITSSVSPVYNNDPEFSVLLDSPRLSDFITYSLDLSSKPPVWRAGYSFLETYRIHTFDKESAAYLVSRIRAENGTARQNYETHYAIGAPPTFKPGGFDYVCALTTLSESDYNNCVCSPKLR